MDGRSVPNQAPEFFNFGVGDGDAALGPIGLAMGCSYMALSIAKSMNHDVAAGIHSVPFAAGAIG